MQQKKWVIIKATKKSSCTDEPPYQVITNDVGDVLESSGNETLQQDAIEKYKMVTMCNRDNRASLMLTPAHGSHVYALAVITSVQGKTLYAENVESLQHADKDNAVKAIRQEMTLVAELLKHTSANKSATWDDTTSPLVSARCRKLGRSPTGPELESLDIHPAKKARIA